MRGRATRLLSYPDGGPFFPCLPLVVHLEDPVFTRLPKSHFEERPPFESENLGDIECFPLAATYLDPIWNWRVAVQDFQDRVLREREERERRVKAGHWETSEELEMVRARSRSDNRRKRPSAAEKRKSKRQRGL